MFIESVLVVVEQCL